MNESPLLAFAEYRLDTTRRLLHRHGVPVDLGDRAFSVLLTLVENAGNVVDKRGLLDAAWPDVTVGDNTLVQAVREIRSALGDDPSNPSFVQTVHRRGYRFVAPVQLLAPGVEAPEDAGIVPSTVPRRWRRVGLVATILVAAVLLGLISLRSAPSPPFVDAELRPLLDLPDGAMKPAFSPSGDFLAAVLADPETGRYTLWLVKPGSEVPLRLTSEPPVQGATPAFTADGSAVLFTSYRNDVTRGNVPDVWEVPVFGGQPRRLLEGGSGASAAPDGSQVVYAKVTAGGTAITVRGSGGVERRIAEPGFWPRWSPDGLWIAFTTSNPEGGNGDVLIIRPDGGGQRCLSAQPSQVYGLCWTRDSRWVIYGSDVDGATNLWIAPVDGGQPTRITRGPGASDSPTVSADGRRLVFSYGLGKSAIYTAAAPGRPLSRIMSQEQAHALSLSPDGARLAVILGGLTRGWSLSVYDLASRQLRRVDTIDAQAVSWAPDGEALVVTAGSPDGQAHWVWRVPLNGGMREPLVRGNHQWQWTELSADGRRLAGSRMVDGVSELVVVDLDSGMETLLDRAPERLSVRWSPDGRWLAWSSPPRPVDSESCGVWVLRLGDSERRRLASDGSWPAWEPDGEHLVFARYGDHSGLWRVARVGGPAEPLYQPGDAMWDYHIFGLDMARSSSSLVVRLEAWTTSLYVLEEAQGSSR